MVHKSIFPTKGSLQVFCQRVSKLIPQAEYQFTQTHMKMDCHVESLTYTDISVWYSLPQRSSVR